VFMIRLILERQKRKIRRNRLCRSQPASDRFFVFYLSLIACRQAPTKTSSRADLVGACLQAISFGERKDSALIVRQLLRKD